ncbi:MAG: hypothetical protein OHK0050_15970 [Roseiflexaceae bacterium]
MNGTHGINTMTIPPLDHQASDPATIREDLPRPTLYPIGVVLTTLDLALNIGHAALAEQAARHLIGLFPEAIVPSIILGRALVEQGNWQQAIDHLRWVLALHPLEGGSWASLAAALALAGRQQEARTALSRAAMHDPLDSQLLTPGVATLPPEGEGIDYLRQGHDQLALTTIQASLEQHPDRRDLLLYRIEALRRLGEQRQAQSMLTALSSDGSLSFPEILLRAALDPNPAPFRSQAARLDLDGTLTRRFFAPSKPPWDLLPAPSIPINDALSQLLPLLKHAPTPAGRKNAATGTSPASANQVESTPAPQAIASDLRSFLETAERMRSRLITAVAGAPPLLSHAEAERQQQVILSSLSGLAKQFGNDTAREVLRRLQVLAEALQQRGLQSHVVVCDRAETWQWNDSIHLPAVANETQPLAQQLRTMRGMLEGQGQEIGTLLIVGGPAVIPAFRLPNPMADDDPELVSDLPYAGIDIQDLTPAISMARLPDGGDPNFLLEQLERMIARYAVKPRNPLARLRPAPTPAERGAWALASGYAAEAWSEPSRVILQAIHPAAILTLSPPADQQNLDINQILGCQVAYFNLHGAIGRQSWYGQPAAWGGAATRLPTALNPDQLIGQCVSGGLLISEACYGLELGRGVSQNIGMRALQEGVAACVGSTVSAYGSYTTPLVGADLLCQRLMTHLANGAAVGTALRQARIEFAQELIRRQGQLDDVDRKTLLSFVLYGDPWATAVAGQPQPHNLNTRPVVIPIHRAQPVAKAALDERQIPRELLAKVRQTLQRVLPSANAARLAISAQIQAGLNIKGEQSTELVFQASERIATADGASITQSAQITVSRNAVVKVALSR